MAESMVIHFRKEHLGDTQKTLFRILIRHQTALDRQIVESVRIEELAAKREEALNLKSK